MRYFVYENWNADNRKARIHEHDCSFCKDGAGIDRDAGHENGRWHGPFADKASAILLAVATQGTVSECQKCCGRA